MSFIEGWALMEAFDDIMILELKAYKDLPEK
jgi:hypothetical protein